MPDTPVALVLLAEWCAFLCADHSDVHPRKLSAEVCQLLEQAPHLPVNVPSRGHVLIVDTVRAYAWELLDYLGAFLGALPADDARRPLCSQCLDAIDVAIKQAWQH